MRIIAGSARGRRLFVPEGMDTRPTADRIRESLFQILGERLNGAVVLDLFAGSGALALEALSRGAAYAMLNDKAPKAVSAIRRNIEAMRVESRTKVLSLDYKQALKALDAPEGLGERKFSLVFLDPPYRMTDCYAQAAEVLRDRALLMRDALLVMEHEKLVKLSIPGGFELIDERIYGDTVVSVYRVQEDNT